MKDIKEIYENYKTEITNLNKGLGQKYKVLNFKNFTAEEEPSIFKVLYETEVEKNKILTNKLSSKVLLVEDGSTDTSKLETDGFYVIIYRQGSTPPRFLNKSD